MHHHPLHQTVVPSRLIARFRFDTSGVPPGDRGTVRAVFLSWTKILGLRLGALRFDGDTACACGK